jgi:hypothetical protein
MEAVKFEVSFESPIGLTVDLQKDLQCTTLPKYRLLKLEMHRINDNVFRLTALFHPEDINPQTEKSELFNIRDRLLSLLSITAMVPVELRTKGAFTFSLGNKQYQQMSLGPMNIRASPVPIRSLRPLIEGQSLPAEYAAAVYLAWQAINSDEPLYRFINTAVCFELIAGADSLEPPSINPKCSNESCGYTLDQCPECRKDWKIPNPLRSRAKFLIPDDSLMSRFIKARNKVFHGASQQQTPGFLDELEQLTIPVLLAVRNHIGQKIGLKPIEAKELSIGSHSVSVIMSVFYRMP